MFSTIFKLSDYRIYKYSFKNVKVWIRKSKDLVAEYNKTARSMRVPPQEKQRASNAADHKKVYIRYCEYYLKTGDWISTFSGEEETNVVAENIKETEN